MLELVDGRVLLQAGDISIIICKSTTEKMKRYRWNGDLGSSVGSSGVIPHHPTRGSAIFSLSCACTANFV